MKHLFVLAALGLILGGCRKELLPSKSEKVLQQAAREGEGEPIRTSEFAYCEGKLPIGGGQGYQEIFQPEEATIYIDAAALNDPMLGGLKGIIENAGAGDIIYIDDVLQINLAGIPTIDVPGGVSIVSGRGNGASLGARLYNSTDTTHGIEFDLTGDNVRFSGLRIEGPWWWATLCQDPNDFDHSARMAICTNRYDNLRIDNCELYAWPYSPVRIGKLELSDPSMGNVIENCYIHANIAVGYGYGVVVVNGFATLSANVFASNRHDISCAGTAGAGFEALCNNIMPGGTEANFESHRSQQNGVSNVGPDAGKFFWIHHNRFYATHKFNVHIEGRPEYQCRVENNIFSRSSPATAIQQGREDGTGFKWFFGNMLVFNNIYHDYRYLGAYVSETWSNAEYDHVLWLSEGNLTSDPTWCNIGEDATRSRMDYQVGDFNGDGLTDIYRNDNTEGPDHTGHYIPVTITSASAGYNTPWTLLHTTGYFADEVHIGEFTGDNKTDAFIYDGGAWWMSDGFNTTWANINTAPWGPPNISFGKFTSDAVTDVFRANGTDMLVSSAGVSSWSTVANSGYTTPNLYTEGDFDGNGLSDVFLGDGITWYVALNPNGGILSSWQAIASSGYSTGDLLFGDLNRDGKTDVISKQGIDWMVSLTNAPSSSNTWKHVTTSHFPRSTFPWGSLQ